MIFTTETPFFFQSMFLEAGGATHEEQEWYYGNKEKERFGPYSLKEVMYLFSYIIIFCWRIQKYHSRCLVARWKLIIKFFSLLINTHLSLHLHRPSCSTINPLHPLITLAFPSSISPLHPIPDPSKIRLSNYQRPLRWTISGKTV